MRNGMSQDTSGCINYPISDLKLELTLLDAIKAMKAWRKKIAVLASFIRTPLIRNRVNDLQPDNGFILKEC